MDLMSTAQLLGNFGEFVGAVAVVITLVFLVVQLRQNTRALEESSRLARIASADENYRDMTRWRDRITTDPELTEVWHKGCAGEELSNTDAERFMQIANELVFGLWRGYEGAVAVDNSELAEELVTVLADFARQPALGLYIRDLADSSVFGPFVSQVVARLADTDSPTVWGPDVYRSLRDRVTAG